MPVLTSTVMRTQYEHVMNVLLRRDPDTSPLAKSLERHYGQGGMSHKDVDNIISLSDPELDSLTYEKLEPDPADATKTTKTIVDTPGADRAAIRGLAGFVVWKQHKGKSINPDQWTNVTFDEYREYHVNHQWEWLNKRASMGGGGFSTSGSGPSTTGNYSA